jgi:hypothetical protein
MLLLLLLPFTSVDCARITTFSMLSVVALMAKFEALPRKAFSVSLPAPPLTTSPDSKVLALPLKSAV